MTTYTLTLPWTRPRLSPNKRMHWAVRARITRDVRTATMWLARARMVRVPHVTVTLHYRPARNGRLDADNLVMDLKACCDGLVDAAIVRDDTPEFMSKVMPVIHSAVKGEPGLLWLEIETTQEKA